MSRYPIKDKRVYPIQKLDPLLVSYLGKWSGGKLTKLRKLSPEGSPFTRWRLEGICNISYKNNTGNKLSLLHSALRFPLQEFFGECLLRVGTELEINDLVLDFQEEEDIFRKIPRETYEVFKDVSPSLFRSREEKLIRIPYIKIFPTRT